MTAGRWESDAVRSAAQFADERNLDGWRDADSVDPVHGGNLPVNRPNNLIRLEYVAGSEHGEESGGERPSYLSEKEWHAIQTGKNAHNRKEWNSASQKIKKREKAEGVRNAQKRANQKKEKGKRDHIKIIVKDAAGVVVLVFTVWLAANLVADTIGVAVLA